MQEQSHNWENWDDEEKAMKIDDVLRDEVILKKEPNLELKLSGLGGITEGSPQRQIDIFIKPGQPKAGKHVATIILEPGALGQSKDECERIIVDKLVEFIADAIHAAHTERRRVTLKLGPNFAVGKEQQPS